MFQDMPTDKVYNTPASYSQYYEELDKKSCGAFGIVYEVSIYSL